jgi:hypothetical protein
LRCKDYFRARKSVEGISLSSDPEQRSDKLRLTLCITSRQSFNLTFAHHIHGFNAFQGSLRCVKALEALRGSHLLFDEEVVLLYHIVQVFITPQFAVLRYNSLGL